MDMWPIVTLEQMALTRKPFIFGFGGTTRQNSSSEMALRKVMDSVAASGAETELMLGPELNFPVFDPTATGRSDRLERFIQLLRRADGVVISTPSYHGCLSGMIKNALDYTEDLREEGYLKGRPVGCIVCADGAQALGSTLAALRSITHTLRAWPTPLALTVDTSRKNPTTGALEYDPDRLLVMAEQVLELAKVHAAGRQRALA